MLLNHGAGPQGRVLSEDGWKLLTQHAAKVPDEDAYYGYGIFSHDVDGHHFIGHSGGMIGYTTSMEGDLDQGIGVTVFENAPFGLHPGATRSYKQVAFGEANLQLTFHEGDRREIDGVNCVLVEPDIDYFKDTLAHLLLEVAVNAFGSITDPRAVYVLRWIAGRRAGIPEFDPLYTIERV